MARRTASQLPVLILLILFPRSALAFSSVISSSSSSSLLSPQSGCNWRNEKPNALIFSTQHAQRRRFVTLCRSTPPSNQPSGNAPKKKKATTNTGRFAQSVHASKIKQSEKSKTQQSQPPLFSSRSQSIRTERPSSTSSSSPPPVSSYSSSSSSSDAMWRRRNRSIEDLEASLTKRWGTDLSQWTAQESELEREDDDNDYDEEGVVVLGETTRFRAKPVPDPWGKNEDPTTTTKTSPIWGKNPADSSKRNDDTWMLQRVQRNQEKVVARRDTRMDKDQWEEDDEEEEEEYYDEDDEDEFYDDDDDEYDDDDDLGPYHSASPTAKKRVMDLSHLLASKPVGGKGTFQTESVAGTTEMPFLFRKAQDVQRDRIASRDDDTTTGTTSEVLEPSKSDPAEPESLQRQQRREFVPSIPLLDEDGKPVYLTTKQANRNFQDALKDTQAWSGAADGDENYDDAVEEDDTDYNEPSFSTQAQSWQDLGVTNPTLLRNLDKMNCPKPLAVQEKACQALLSSNDSDVLIGTYTGSGKTLAFLVPIAQKLQQLIDDETNQEKVGDKNKSDRGIQAIIVAPGRELASQIVSVVRELLQDSTLSALLAIGGVTFTRNLEQIRKRKPSILVGTPGRLAELIVGKPGERQQRSGRLKINNLQFLVLDEFDALLQYSPHKDPTIALMESLRKRFGERLRSVLCSATASDMLNTPKMGNFVRPGFSVVLADEDDRLVTAADTHDSRLGRGSMTRVSRTVIHGVVHVPHRRLALDTLRRILHTEPLPQQILVFVENSRKVKIVVDKLEEMGIIAAPLHGGMGSEKTDRAEVSKALREGYVGLVVATELAARGLDAPLLTHVINFDLPTDASHYAHRAGRVGRGGRPGVVINITTNPQERNVPQKFADKLGVDMYTVEAKNGRLNIVNPSSQLIDSQ